MQNKGFRHLTSACADPEGGGDRLNNHKATKPAFNVGLLSARQQMQHFNGV